MASRHERALPRNPEDHHGPPASHHGELTHVGFVVARRMQQRSQRRLVCPLGSFPVFGGWRSSVYVTAATV